MSATRKSTSIFPNRRTALVDIETIKRRATAIFETMQEPLMVLDSNLCLLTVNPAFCRTFHVSRAKAEGASLFKLGHEAWDVPELHALVKEVLPKEKRFEAFRLEREFPIIGRRTFLLNGQQMFDAGIGTNTVLIVFQDVTDREIATRELQALTSRLRDEQELADARLARELHDLSSQGFAGLSLELARLTRLVSSAPNEVEQGLRTLGARVSALALSTHELTRRLHPSVLDDLGLIKSLQAECQAFQERSHLPVKFHSKGLPIKLPKPISLCLYRVAQEALRNIAAHAQAERVDLTLNITRTHVRLMIRDNGIGFDSIVVRDKGRLGLLGMSERVTAIGGSVSFDSTLGSGTRVKVVIPMQRGEKPQRR